MKPRRAHTSNFVFRLQGGTEDNDLWVQKAVDRDMVPICCSVWEPTAEERDRIARGENIELAVWGGGHPPVQLQVTDVPLGKPPSPDADDETEDQAA